MSRTIATFVIAIGLFLTWTGSAAADSSWLPRWLGGKTDAVTSAKGKSANAAKSRKAASKKGSNLFASTKDLFAPKKKKRIVSKYPSERVQASHSKDDRPWYSRMFVPEEPSPPRSVGEWMELEQIKP
jgi:hypothetical protein